MPAIFSPRDEDMFKEFLDTEGKRILFYHRDADGVCSSALLLKFFPSFEFIPRKGPKADKNFINLLVKKDPFLVVFLDLPMDQEKETLKKLRNKLPSCRFAIVDHHIIEHDMNSKDIVHINPRFKLKNSYIPVSYVIYRLLGSMGLDVENYIWIAMTGVIGDHAYSECPDMIRECKSRFPELVGKDIAKSKLKQAADMIGSAITYKSYSGANKVLEILISSEEFEDFISNELIKEWKLKTDKEFKRLMEFFKKQKKEYPKANMIAYELKTDYNLSSAIASEISENNPNKIVFVYKKTNNAWKFSLRYQRGDINLGEIVKRCLSKEDSGGGHERAAGGMVKDIKGFKEKLIGSISAKN